MLPTTWARTTGDTDGTGVAVGVADGDDVADAVAPVPAG